MRSQQSPQRLRRGSVSGRSRSREGSLTTRSKSANITSDASGCVTYTSCSIRSRQFAPLTLRGLPALLDARQQWMRTLLAATGSAPELPNVLELSTIGMATSGEEVSDLLKASRTSVLDLLEAEALRARVWQTARIPRPIRKGSEELG